MNRKKFLKTLFLVAIFILIANIKVYATTEEPSQIDNEAPIFNGNIQTRYVVKRAEDGSKFNPQDVIKGITATDNVDGTNVDIELVQNQVDLSSEGEYYVVYSATDKAGNTSLLGITIIVDGTGPVFAEDLENLYYINQQGIILDSKYNVVDSLPQTLTATDSVGAYKGIGVYIGIDENGNIVFVNTIEGSPAVGILESNDILIEVDGEDVRGQTSAYVATRIKGEAGTDVELKIIRNNEEKTVTIKRQVVKLYEDEEFAAEPTVEIDSIDIKENGVIEITYVATDEAGNSTEFVVRVVIDKTAPILYLNGKRTDEDEVYYTVVTTGDPPPEEIEFEFPVVTAIDYDVMEEKEKNIDSNSIKVDRDYNQEELTASETPYIVTYTATDAVGNSATLTVHVTVVNEKNDEQSTVDELEVDTVDELEVDKESTLDNQEVPVSETQNELTEDDLTQDVEVTPDEEQNIAVTPDEVQEDIETENADDNENLGDTEINYIEQ